MNLSYLYKLNFSVLSKIIMIWMEEEYKIHKFCFKKGYFDKNTNSFYLVYNYDGYDRVRIINFSRINNQFVIRVYYNFFFLEKCNPFLIFEKVASAIINNIELISYPLTHRHKHMLDIDFKAEVIYCSSLLYYFNNYIVKKS